MQTYSNECTRDDVEYHMPLGGVRLVLDKDEIEEWGDEEDGTFDELREGDDEPKASSMV